MGFLRYHSGLLAWPKHLRSVFEVINLQLLFSVHVYLRSFQVMLVNCSLRYHLLHPDYLYFRIRELQKHFKLRVVLCHVDVVSEISNAFLKYCIWCLMIMHRKIRWSPCLKSRKPLFSMIAPYCVPGGINLLICWTHISMALLLVYTTFPSCSMTECARYLETIKVYENKPADLIQGQMDTDYLSRVWKPRSSFFF